GSAVGSVGGPAAAPFLRESRRRLFPVDTLVLGTDLEKPVSDLLPAYDDPAGVTAAFNLNLLARINREIDGDFVLRNFAHEVRYDEDERRIEMHLRSRQKQTVRIRAADFTCTLQAGETIWTE